MEKFRAYDKQTSHMYYAPNQHIYMNIDGTCVNFQNGEILEVMFETGYHDETGKDVYAEDIVKDDVGTIGIIIFQYGHWEINRVKGPYQYPAFHSRISGFKVIGNIKQHKIEDFK